LLRVEVARSCTSRFAVIVHIERILQINALHVVTKEVVEATQENPP
jgi:hypothetical protein